MIEILKKKPSKKYFKPLLRYQNIRFKKKFSIKVIEDFMKFFPEEGRGRKNFHNKEILNMKAIIYNQIINKGYKINADCIQTVSEQVVNNQILITVSYYKKNV